MPSFRTYRKLSIADNVIPNDRINGDITVEEVINKGWVLRCSIFENNWQYTANLIKYMAGIEPISFEGGYPPEDHRTLLFQGYIRDIKPNLGDDGIVTVDFEASNVNPLFSQIARTVVYGAKAQKKNAILNDQGEVIYVIRPWASEVRYVHEIIEHIIDEQGYEMAEGHPMINDEYNTRLDSKYEIVQDDKSDWKFLQELAEKYHCHMYLDARTRTFYFYDRAKTANFRPAIGFSYHYRGSMLSSQPNPLLPNPVLTMSGVDLRIPFMLGTFPEVKTVVDKHGVEHEIIEGRVDPTSLGGWHLILSMLIDPLTGRITPEAQAYLDDPDSWTWEKTLKFWRRHTFKDYGREDGSITTEDAFIGLAYLTFTVPGSVHITTGAQYPIYNIPLRPGDPGDGKLAWVCDRVSHVIGEEYNCELDMRLAQ